MSLFKTLLDYTTVIFGSVFTRGFAFLNSLILARVLGPEQFGIFSIFFTVMILTWQLPQAFDGVFVTFAQRYQDIHRKNEILKTSIFLKIIYFAIVVATSYPFASFLANICFRKAEAFWPVFIALICGVFLMFLMTIASTFQADMKFAKYASVNAVYTVTVFLFLVTYYLLKGSMSLYYVILTYLFIAMIVGSVCLVLLKRRLKNIFSIDREILKKVFEQGKWVFLVVAASCIFSRLDLLVLPVFLDYAEIGLYAVAVQLILVVDMASGALAGLCLPRAGAAVLSRKAFSAFIKESALIILMIEAGIVILLLTAPFIVSMAYGTEYRYAGTVLRYLLYGWMFHVIMVPFSFLYTAIEDSRTRFTLEIFKLVVGVGLLYALVPRFGMVGSACTVSITLATSSIISAFVLKFRLSKSFRQILT